MPIFSPVASFAPEVSMGRDSKNWCFIFVLFLASALISPAQTLSSSKQTALENFLTAPIGFEPNTGQMDPNIRFTSRAAGYSVYLTRSELLVAFDGQGGDRAGPETIRVTLVGADRTVEPQGEGPLPGVSHYYIGSDPSQ